ncbi:MAG: ABC transporter ATP-binding protein [Acholeplasmatales bacterium]|nr:ABC transporter ATP-binding protein [Acholeplasmatales bacterium]
MLRLYKKLSKKDFLFVFLIVGLTILQVYLTMTLVDYVQGIIKAITLVNYHNNPADISKDVALFLETIGGWDNLKEEALILAGLPNEMISQVMSIKNATQADIWFNGGMMVAVATASMGVQAIISILASFVAADLSTNIRTSLYRKVEDFSLEEIDKFSTASLITRTTNDIQQIQMANLFTMRMIFQAPVTAIWALCKFHSAASELTIATVITLLILIVIIAIIMLVAIPKFKVMQKLTDNLNGVMRDNLTGIRIVRAFNAENYQENKFEKANLVFTKTQLFTGRVMALLSPMMMIIMNALTLTIYLIGSNLINAGKIDYAGVTASTMLGTQLIMAFVMLMLLFMMWPRALVGAQRINEVLDTESKIIDSANPVQFKEEGTIEFKNVSFKYPNGENNVINDISFKVNKGETLAIIGATSAGKTSLVNLIARLYDTTEGEVLVDGVNVKDVKQHDLREKIGFVPQKGFLFNGTIKENICFGSDVINDDEVIKAANVACVSDFIQTIDNGYDFVISQSGKNVSGGQRQRLCIARAIYKNPQIYIFDDSFSALDYKTDKALRENLKNMENNSTKIIVAQRIGTIMDADKIIVLDGGKMVGFGKHEELLKSCAIYKEIALSQLSEKELGL